LWGSISASFSKTLYFPNAYIHVSTMSQHFPWWVRDHSYNISQCDKGVVEQGVPLLEWSGAICAVLEYEGVPPFPMSQWKAKAQLWWTSPSTCQWTQVCLGLFISRFPKQVIVLCLDVTLRF
jgi:hypothetical protein